MPPKRHHFIPILHLKHFVGADPAGQVWTYDAKSGEVWSATPENTAVQSHFYSIELDDGTMDTRLEDYLTSVENFAAPVYESLLAGQLPEKNSQARADFTTFLAIMYLRTPAMRRMSGEMTGRMMQQLSYAYGVNEKAFEGLIRRAERAGERPLTPEEKERLREDLIDPSRYVMKIPKERTFHVFDVADRLAPILYNMKWSIAAPLHGFFITTDNPLVREVDPRSRHPVLGDYGFLNKTAEVIFPLSPNLVLLLSWHDDALERGFFERGRVDRINQGLAAQSDQYIYAHIHDKRVGRLASKFKHSRPGITSTGYGPESYAKIEVSRRMRAR